MQPQRQRAFSYLEQRLLVNHLARGRHTVRSLDRVGRICARDAESKQLKRETRHHPDQRAEPPLARSLNCSLILHS